MYYFGQLLVAGLFLLLGGWALFKAYSLNRKIEVGTTWQKISVVLLVLLGLFLIIGSFSQFGRISGEINPNGHTEYQTNELMIGIGTGIVAALLSEVYFKSKKRDEAKPKGQKALTSILAIIIALLIMVTTGHLVNYFIGADPDQLETAQTTPSPYPLVPVEPPAKVTQEAATNSCAQQTVDENTGITLEEATTFCSCNSNKLVEKYGSFDRVLELIEQNDSTFIAYREQIEPGCLEQAGLVYAE